jgi:hypothetical protein
VALKATGTVRARVARSAHDDSLFPDATAGTDVYFSVDVETDGPIPGRYSMLSFGIVVAGTFDGKTFRRADPTARTFYAELKPISDHWQPDALAVNGLDRASLLVHGREPRDAMSEAATWIAAQAGAGRPVMVAFPVAFDWAFLYWYLVSFSDSGSPFGHASCLDIKTAYAVKAGAPIVAAGLRSIPAHLQSRRAHTHRALDDATEQADLFANIVEWQP